MDRRVVIIALVVVLTLLALMLAGLASGAGTTNRDLRPSMSGEFAHMQLASVDEQHQLPAHECLAGSEA